MSFEKVYYKGKEMKRDVDAKEGVIYMVDDEPRKILEKAIQKAIDGGWAAGGLNTPVARKNYTMQDIVDYFTDDATNYSHADIIFDHEFAKALWGEGRMSSTEGLNGFAFDPAPVGDWKSHLQAMVISEDPIKYLENHLT